MPAGLRWAAGRFAVMARSQGPILDINSISNLRSRPVKQRRFPPAPLRAAAPGSGSAGTARGRLRVAKLPPPARPVTIGSSGPFHPVKALALFEPVGREVALVDGEDAMLPACVGEPDQRRVGKIDVAIGVARDDCRDFHIGLDG